MPITPKPITPTSSPFTVPKSETPKPKCYNADYAQADYANTSPSVLHQVRNANAETRQCRLSSSRLRQHRHALVLPSSSLYTLFFFDIFLLKVQRERIKVFQLSVNRNLHTVLAVYTNFNRNWYTVFIRPSTQPSTATQIPFSPSPSTTQQFRSRSPLTQQPTHQSPSVPQIISNIDFQIHR